MRVLLLNQYSPPDPCSTGQLLAGLAAALVERGHEAHVVCSRRSYRGGSVRYPTEEIRDGVHVHRIPTTGLGRRTLASRAIDCAGFYPRALARALCLPRADVCVAMTMPPLVGLLGRALRPRGTRLVLWVMDLFEEMMATFGVIRAGGPAHRALLALAREVHAGASTVVSIGDGMSARLLAAGVPRRKLVQIPNWMPGEPAAAVPREASRARARWGLDRRVVLLYSGNHGLGHELDTAVRALARARTRADVQALFVGEGQERPRVERMCRQLGVNAVFRPSQPLNTLADTLAAGDIHLVGQSAARLGISVPCKVYGALAVGRPTLFIGPPESEIAGMLDRADAGRAVACGDVEGATAALVELASNPALREAMGRRARACHDAELGAARSLSRLVKVVERT